MVLIDRIRKRVGDTSLNRRWIATLVLLLLVLLGLGIGSINEGTEGELPGVLPDDDPDTPPDVELETPTESTQTPSPTPTPTPDGGSTPTPDDTPSDSSTGGVSAESTTPTETETDQPDDNDDDGDGEAERESSDRVDLEIRNDTVRIQVANVVPGDEVSETVVIANNGSSDGLPGAVVRDIEDRENSLLEPEREAGDTTAGEGELSSAVRIRVSVDRPDGSRAYLFGDADRYVPLRSIEGKPATGDRTLASGEDAPLRFELMLPEETSNRIQSDSLSFDVAVFLRIA